MPDDSKAAGALLVSLRAIWAPLVTSESFVCVFDRPLIADFAPNKNADDVFWAEGQPLSHIQCR
jgi:hypothetical protein